jgi:hypothetical protein
MQWLREESAMTTLEISVLNSEILVRWQLMVLLLFAGYT